MRRFDENASDSAVKTSVTVSFLLPAGLEARRVFDDAQKLLHKMIDNCSLKGRGLVGFWRAQSDGDDINVYKDDVTVHRDTKPIATFHGLRQQVRFQAGEELSIMATEALCVCVMLAVLSSKKEKKGKTGCTSGWHERSVRTTNFILFHCPT